MYSLPKLPVTPKKNKTSCNRSMQYENEKKKKFV